MSRLQSDRGFALPLTLFVVALITVMLSAVFVRVRNEHRIADSSGDMVTALAVAQTGLQSYMGAVSFDGCYRAARPLDGDSVRYNVQGGYADVVANVVKKPADSLKPWMYVVRSTGYVIDPTQGTDPQARRTVAQFAWWQRNHIEVLAAYTAANGFTNLKTSGGELKGADSAPAGCKEPDVPALRVPNGQAPTTWMPGLDSIVDYATDGLSPAVVASGTGQSVADETGVDWVRTITGGIVPDYDYIQLWDFDYPTMLVLGDVDLDCSSGDIGFGLLIVTGELTIQGSGSDCIYWYGVILTGDELDWNADGQLIDGMAVSGLNEQTGVSVLKGDVDGAKLDIDYDSWYVRRALASLAGFAPIGNAWVDNWSSY